MPIHNFDQGQEDYHQTINVKLLTSKYNLALFYNRNSAMGCNDKKRLKLAHSSLELLLKKGTKFFSRKIYYRHPGSRNS